MISLMRALLLVTLSGVLATAGCAERADKAPPTGEAPRAGTAHPPAGAATTNSTLIVTPDDTLAGKVALVNATARYVVLSFPLGRMAVPDQRLSLYRRGLKVGEVRVTGWQREDNVVADLIAGEAEVGDKARGQ